MTATHDHDTTTSGVPSNQVRSTAGRRGVIAGAAVVLACAVACSLSLLLAAGAAVTAGAFVSGAEPIAIGALLLTALVVGGLWLRRRRARLAGATRRATRDARP